MLRGLLICIAFFLTIAMMGQSQHYVSTTGNDNNHATTVNQAWKTIQHALNQLTQNATLNILDGTYNEKVYVNVSGSLGQPIIISNYNDDIVVVDGSNLPNDDA
ncbi:MAG: hypothetical protein ACJA01_003601, partial [Saprospiraceae bacterium]